MPPPEHADSARHDSYHDYLVEHGFKENKRLGETVDRLSAWLEFLLHPETHDHDREAFGPFQPTGGTWVWQEQSERLYDYNTGEELEFRSVLHQYRYSDFLDPLVAVSTQQVEKGDSLLALASAAMANIYWAGNKFTGELANFPDEWKGTASVEAQKFVARLESVATQLNKIVFELQHLLPKYALVIKAARVDLEAAARALVENFEEKFRTKAENQFSLDILGLVVSAVTAAAGVYLGGGAGVLIIEGMVADLWKNTFTQAVTHVFKGEDKKVGTVAGYWWKDLAASYMEEKDKILREATAAMTALNVEMTALAAQFLAQVPAFEDTLPGVDVLPQQGG